jgi:hypothetical protein
MATLYETSGRTKEISPANGVHWTAEELRALVGGYTEVVSTIDGTFMVVNEAYKVLDLELNIPATRLYIHGRSDVILGPAVVVDTRLELDGPRDEEGLQEDVH